MNEFDYDDGFIEGITLFPIYYLDETGKPVEVPEVPPEQISFHGSFSWILYRPYLAFFARHQRRQIQCEVSWKTLSALFHSKVSSEGEAEALYLAHRHELEEMARTLIEQGKVTADDRVLIE